MRLWLGRDREGAVMDKDEIRAKAEKLYDRLGHYNRSGGDDIGEIEAALTAAYDAGWDKGVERIAKLEGQLAETAQVLDENWARSRQREVVLREALEWIAKGSGHNAYRARVALEVK